MDVIQYRKRELVGVIIGSFVYAFITLALVSAGVEQAIGTLWTLVLAAMISGVLTFVLSYIIVFKWWNWLAGHRTKIVSIAVVLLLILLTQLGRVAR